MIVEPGAPILPPDRGAEKGTLFVDIHGEVGSVDAGFKVYAPVLFGATDPSNTNWARAFFCVMYEFRVLLQSLDLPHRYCDWVLAVGNSRSTCTIDLCKPVRHGHRFQRRCSAGS